MRNFVLVMIGGAIGAALRYEIGRIALQRLEHAFPWATLAVNLAGGLLIGLLAGHMFERSADDGLWAFAAVGLLGGFTTFSAFSLDMFALIEHGRAGLAFLYAAVSALGSLGLVYIGFWLIRAAA